MNARVAKKKKKESRRGSMFRKILITEKTFKVK